MDNGTAMLLLLWGAGSQFGEIRVRRYVRYLLELVQLPHLSLGQIQASGKLYAFEFGSPLDDQIPFLDLTYSVLLFCSLGSRDGKLRIPMCELEGRAAVSGYDPEVLWVAVADGVPELGREPKVVAQVGDLLKEDPTIERHHQ